jgi:tRNA threonylcarbamoyladenosine biosynthesis protein TsaE
MAVTTTYTISTIDELEAVALHLSQLAATAKIFLFKGPMGAGKTTLIKAMCQKLGVKDEMSSPTFSLVNEYKASNGLIYHFDLYRIEREEELFDLGYEEYFYSGYLCLVEWPEMAPSILPQTNVTVAIELHNASRIITVTHHP